MISELAKEMIAMAHPTHIVTAAGFVYDGDGNMLLVKTYHRGWETPGGQVDNGESLEDAVIREILEESGIKVSLTKLIGVYSNVGTNVGYDGSTVVPTKVMFDFMCEYVEGTPATSDETSEVLWVPREKVFEYVTHPVFVWRFKKAMEFDGRVCYCSYVSQPVFKVLSERYL